MDRKRIIIEEVSYDQYAQLAREHGRKPVPRKKREFRDGYGMISQGLEYLSWGELIDDITCIDEQVIQSIWLPGRGDGIGKVVRDGYRIKGREFFPELEEILKQQTILDSTITFAMDFLPPSFDPEYDSDMDSQKDTLDFNVSGNGRIYTARAYLASPDSMEKYSVIGHFDFNGHLHAFSPKK